MTCMTHELPVNTGDSATERVILNVELEAGDASAPLRVLSLLARRRCLVRSAAFALADGAEQSTLRVELEPTARGAATIERWVSNLISVRGVTREPS